ncbi:B12-binding domain-containing radical SAM protein [Clostridium sporogenes]|uniref:B12-binding domain-containing radical SAM protein n=1 Tax=Clostridium sporogenes TaxID=1509 RepID=UPI00223758F4|nr:B12-binding domain-containing radical SAM protein [Clostridium sporogenes]EKS4342839.1 B12-binding domain-containing radical SAM protein [Clostridium botulinum]EKS4393303.1 B12-binding domain-containing radical SAM protein [Clostridium botulinum]MCW6079174.1 B12-binding domain-containing radical SAM protein [Clostridium sporogenes]
MKALLVAINSKYIHSNLALRYLRANTEDLNYECMLKEFTINDRKENILEKIIMEKADLVAFSCYIWNLEYVEELANLIKLVKPSTEIIFGGPEVSYDSESFLRKVPGEYIIRGEGEETFREFIKCKIENKSLDKVKGLYIKTLNGIEYTGERHNISMNSVVFPYKKEEDLKNKIVYYEASRGCPFKCKYCLSSTLHGVRFHDIERVKKEIKFLVDKSVKLIKFVDRTFNCNHKFAMEVWEYIINLDTDATFHFEISADLLTKEELDILSKSKEGRIQFEVGVQTTNNEVLKNINRHVNFETIKEKVEELKKLKNIKQHLDLIAGLPGEDYNSFKNSFNDVYSIEPEEIQLGFLKLLKGSPMRSEAEKWGMVYSPYPPYEILNTKDISYEELLILKKVEGVVDKYYNSGKFNNILKYFMGEFKKPFDFYYRLAMFCNDKGYFDRNISGPQYYKVFLEFNEEFLNKNSEFLKEIIKYDYLKFNKKQWMPEFLIRDIDKKIKRYLKDKLLQNRVQISDNIHVEKFFIDIEKFIRSGIKEKREIYVIFDEKDRENIVFLGNKE